METTQRKRLQQSIAQEVEASRGPIKTVAHRRDGITETLYPHVDLAVGVSDEGQIVLTIAVPGEVHLFPMSQDAAQQIGKALTAPRVARPGA